MLHHARAPRLSDPVNSHLDSFCAPPALPVFYPISPLSILQFLSRLIVNSILSSSLRHLPLYGRRPQFSPSRDPDRSSISSLPLWARCVDTCMRCMPLVVCIVVAVPRHHPSSSLPSSCRPCSKPCRSGEFSPGQLLRSPCALYISFIYILLHCQASYAVVPSRHRFYSIITVFSLPLFVALARPLLLLSCLYFPSCYDSHISGSCCTN